MWKRSAAIALGAAIGLGLAGAALAGESYTVHAALSARAEVPAPAGASGVGNFTGRYVENANGAVLTWKLVFNHLSGPATAAHIHLGKPGKAGAVLVPLCGPCRSGQSGKVTITKAVIAKLEAGSTYVNVHTAKNAAGEIRGQIKVSG